MNQRVAIAVQESNDGKQIVAEHFGGCTKFNVCEIDEQKKIVKSETYFNPIAGEHGGVCQLPGFVHQFNVHTIIAGGMGQKAVTNFQHFGIDVITAPGLVYEEALSLFMQEKLRGYDICQHEHEHHH
jgi:predicted Fe-Mo cluster-binding NifX family protein